MFTFLENFKLLSKPQKTSFETIYSKRTPQQ